MVSDPDNVYAYCDYSSCALSLFFCYCEWFTDKISQLWLCLLFVFNIRVPIDKDGLAENNCLV